MEGRRLDTQGIDNVQVANRRALFNDHINTCKDCQPTMCFRAQTLWRDVCLTALRADCKGGIASGCKDGA